MVNVGNDGDVSDLHGFRDARDVERLSFYLSP
jgi:hypothetical protein